MEDDAYWKDRLRDASSGRAAGSAGPACSATDLLLAAILLGRFSPLAPHHAGAIRERLRELNDNELRELVATGKWPNAAGQTPAAMTGGNG